MPKKPSLLISMQDRPPLSTRRWHTLEVQRVHKQARGLVRFEIGVLDDARQAGRTVLHDLPAVLTPGSPLCRFLDAAFRVHPSQGQSFDLATVLNRRFQARFDQGVEGCLQVIVAVRPFEHRTVVPATNVNEPNEKKEQGDGLGQSH
jgi:hypothetical protein